MRPAGIACVLVLLLMLTDTLAAGAEEHAEDDSPNQRIGSRRSSQSAISNSTLTTVQVKKHRSQVNGGKNLTLSERRNQKSRRGPCARRANCPNHPRSHAKNHPRVPVEVLDNRGPNRNKPNRRKLPNKNRRTKLGNRANRNGSNFRSPKMKTKSLSPQGFRRSKHRDNNNFGSLDQVSKIMYNDPRKSATYLADQKKADFLNVMQTFFDNESAYRRRFTNPRRKGPKGSWLSGGYDIDSTMELVSTKFASNAYSDYDDENQKSLSSVYQDYHNPLRHSLVNLLTELFLSLHNTTLDGNYEVVSGLANENVEVTESANDFCQRWIDHKDKLEAVFLGPTMLLPSCPCIYPSNIFYNDKIWDKRQQKNFRWRDASGKSQRMDIYKPGAFYCVRSLLAQGSGSAAAQHCCYDQERRLITRGSGAGTPNFVSPEASQVLHEKIDLLPWQLCKGDFSRYNSMRPPNNDNNCQQNPDEKEYQRQKAERKSF